MFKDTIQTVFAFGLLVGASFALPQARAMSFRGDFDGDRARDDVLIQQDSTGKIAVVLNFASSYDVEVAVLRDWKPSWELHPADFNGDGVDDIFAIDLENERVKMVLAESHIFDYGTATSAPLYYVGDTLPGWDDFGLDHAVGTNRIELIESWDSKSKTQFGLNYLYAAGRFIPNAAEAQLVQYNPNNGIVHIRRHMAQSLSNQHVTEQVLLDSYGAVIVGASLSVFQVGNEDTLTVVTRGGEGLSYAMDIGGRLVEISAPVDPHCDEAYGCGDVDLDPLCNPAVEECGTQPQTSSDAPTTVTKPQEEGGNGCLVTSPSSVSDISWHTAFLPFLLSIVGLIIARRRQVNVRDCA